MFGWKLFRRPAQIENVQEKNNLVVHDEFGLGNRMWDELTKIISRVEGCVLKEDIVFVWL